MRSSYLFLFPFLLTTTILCIPGPNEPTATVDSSLPAPPWSPPADTTATNVADGAQDRGAKEAEGAEAAAQLTRDAEEARKTHGFQCEQCRHAVSKLVATNVREVCGSAPRATPTMGSDWSVERRRGECERWVEEHSPRLAAAMSPYSMCRRMGHCGSAAERAAVASTSLYNAAPVQVVRAARGSPKMEYKVEKAIAPEYYPVLSCAYPVTGPMGQSTTVLVRGKGFTKDTVCVIDRTSCATTFVDDTTLTCEVPMAIEPGRARLELFGHNQWGDSSLSEEGIEFRYALEPKSIIGEIFLLTLKDVAARNPAEGAKVNSWDSSWDKGVPPGTNTERVSMAATQDDDALKPTYHAKATPAGGPALVFSGEQRMRLPTTTIERFALVEPSTGVTVFAVVKPTGPRRKPGQPWIFDVGQFGMSRGYGLALATDYISMYSPADHQESYLRTPVDEWVIVTMVIAFKEGQRARLNGASEWTLSQGVALEDLALGPRLSANVASGVFTIGAEAQSGPTRNAFYTGEMAALLVYDTALSEDALRTVEEELSRKHGIRIEPVDKGPACPAPKCPADAQGTVCGGTFKGECTPLTGKCKCHKGFQGVDCTESTCPKDKEGHDCSGRGKCIEGKCQCEKGVSGDACDVAEDGHH